MTGKVSILPRKVPENLKDNSDTPHEVTGNEAPNPYLISQKTPMKENPPRDPPETFRGMGDGGWG